MRQSTIPDMVSAAESNPNAQLFVRTLSFESNAKWITEGAIPIENFAWDDLSANGGTSMGAALDLLATELTIPPMSERALPPVLVLLSDGMPTDDYKTALDKLLHLPWGKKSIRIEADFLRQTYKDLTPGYHMNKTHWNTVALGGDVPSEHLQYMIGQSYDLIKPKVRTKR